MKQKIMSKLKKIIIAVVFVIVSVWLGLLYNDKVSFDNPKHYRQAVDFYNKGDYENAYYNFAKVKNISPLYKAALLKEGICAEKLGDYPTAIKKYKLLTEKYPRSIFVPKAHYRLAKCYYFSKQNSNAQKEFLAIKKHSKVDDFAIASNYYLGLIDKATNPKSAKEYFSEYIENSPNGTFALASAQALTDMKIDLTPKQNQLIGEVYFKNAKYDAAVKAFSHSKMDKSWAYSAISYKKLGYMPQAKAYFETGIKKYSRAVKPEVLDEALSQYAGMIGSDPKLAWFKVSKLVGDSRAAGEDYVLYNLAKYLKQPEQLKLYAKVAYKYPNSRYASDALWKLFWHDYLKKDYKHAAKIGEAHLKQYPKSKTNPRMLFWMAKLSQNMGKSNDANGYFNKIIKNYPDDYYAYRADAMLKGLGNSWGAKSFHKIDERDFNIIFPIKYSNLDIKDLKMVTTLLDLGDYDIWSEVPFDNKFVLSWFEYKKGDKSKSVLYAREALASLDDKPPFTDDAYKLAYPIYWPKDINKYSKELGLDPYLMISLIREESYFNAESRSASNAVGLMQLMPSTASYIAGKYGIAQPTVFTLENPVNNICYGSYYLKYVKRQLNESDLMAVAAYNGGPNAVKYWQKDLKYKDYDEFIENIPYSETRDYIKKVYRSYWNYVNIYNY